MYPMHPQIAPEMLSPLSEIPFHQHRIDAHTDHNEERLEAQGQQGAEIVLSRVSPLPVRHVANGMGPIEVTKYTSIILP